jgi:hypothetical protein
MNFGYFIAAAVLYVVAYILSIASGFVRFPVALIVTTLGSMVLKLVSVILVIVGVYKIIKGSKFTNIEEEEKIK